MAKKYIKGNTYGDWTVLSDEIVDKKRLCECKCGVREYINSSNLASGKTQGCTKCRPKKIHKDKDIKGDASRSSPYFGLYTSYRAMRNRCYDSRTNGFEAYGGKGIVVYHEWMNDYQSFRRWAVSNGWEEGLVIDRVDSTKDYAPDNCRWITKSENSKLANTDRPNPNRALSPETVRAIRAEKLSQKKATKLTLAMVAEKYGISRRMCETIRQRRQYKDIE